MARKILLVDDEPLILKGLKYSLEQDGYLTDSAMDGEEALAKFFAGEYDLILLDVMLPGLDGIEVCQRIRERSNVPIIMLTAKGEDMDKILGLEYGADDYMTKPFDPKELIARIKAVMRRTQTAVAPERELAFPNLVINMSTYLVTYNGKDIEMPPKEIELLYFLAAHPNKVFTRDQLLEQVWGFDYFGDSRTVDVHIKRIREKLPGSEEYGWQIKTVWSVGYKFEVK